MGGGLFSLAVMEIESPIPLHIWCGTFLTHNVTAAKPLSKQHGLVSHSSTYAPMYHLPSTYSLSIPTFLTIRFQ